MFLHVSALLLCDGRGKKEVGFFFIFDNAVEGGERLGFIHFWVNCCQFLYKKNPSALTKICSVYTQKKKIDSEFIREKKNVKDMFTLELPDTS